MGIGYRIKEARISRGLTQEELGSLVGVTGSAITNYEKETSHPKEKIIYMLLDVLKVDANYLFQDCVSTIKKAPLFSSEAIAVAAAYERADEKSRDLVRLTLKEYMVVPSEKEKADAI